MGVALSQKIFNFLQPTIASSSLAPNILKHPQSITDNQENTINTTMHLLCNRKLHVSVLVDHHHAIYKEIYY
jgi:hypothetical protein